MKYILYRSFGDLDKDIKKHELVAVETGKNIGSRRRFPHERSSVKERYGVVVDFGEEKIIYKETIRNAVEGVGHF